MARHAARHHHQLLVLRRDVVPREEADGRAARYELRACVLANQAPEYDGDRFVPVLGIAHDGQTAGLGGPTLDSPGSAPVA
jgi:hypothetical protein